MIKIVLADDHKIMSEGIKLILEREREIKVVGYARTALETMNLCTQLQPDMIVMDISLPSLDGVEGIKRIKDKFPSLKIMIFTGCSDAELMVQAIHHGVNGYILKDISPDELIMAVKSAVTGLSIMHKDALKGIVEHVNLYKQTSFLSEDKVALPLTEREINIIRHIVEGKENREIAKSLFVSEGTIKNTISGILKKLEVRDRIQLVVYAIRNRLVS
ncbi:response regulator [Paenibacillus hexagrammi]|uniref:Response regulator transcription factor n=1 Tax=Paenibacillus hexagrammi TaxID=2908839 RepID=A0ABY3SMR1_9BACL|nr:response regulator transcription factor [Paenibacillus sp. YPD9-1]UJF34491.1 response regulator transcription factor [Paenibacillus sp. YPD9-1]